MKKWELIGISYRGLWGDSTATIFNLDRGYYKQIRFFDYTRKGIIARLRKEYDCIVSHEFY